MGLIEIGDVLEYGDGASFEVRVIKKGRYGIFCQGPSSAQNGSDDWTYLIPELSQGEAVYGWYGWAVWRTFVLASGIKVGSVVFSRYDPRTHDVPEYDTEWERTIATIRDEQMAAMGESDEG